MVEELSNPIGFLQEFGQNHRRASYPLYTEVGYCGADHTRRFAYKCTFIGFEVIGMADQKKQAKNNAAKLMIQRLKDNNYFDQTNYDVTETNRLPNNEISRIIASNVLPSKNPISAIQEYAVACKFGMPKYTECLTFKNRFKYQCSMNGNITYGYGTTKKFAKTQAAESMCFKVGIFGSIDVSETNEDEEDEAVPREGNAISALRAICSSSEGLQEPVYENRGEINDSSVVVCDVGPIAAEGEDLTEIGARILASSKVIGRILSCEMSKAGSVIQRNAQTSTIPEHFEQPYRGRNRRYDQSPLPLNVRLYGLRLDDAGEGSTNTVTAAQMEARSVPRSVMQRYKSSTIPEHFEQPYRGRNRKDDKSPLPLNVRLYASRLDDAGEGSNNTETQACSVPYMSKKGFRFPKF